MRKVLIYLLIFIFSSITVFSLCKVEPKKVHASTGSLPVTFETKLNGTTYKNAYKINVNVSSSNNYKTSATAKLTLTKPSSENDKCVKLALGKDSLSTYQADSVYSCLNIPITLTVPKGAGFKESSKTAPSGCRLNFKKSDNSTGSLDHVFATGTRTVKAYMQVHLSHFNISSGTVKGCSSNITAHYVDTFNIKYDGATATTVHYGVTAAKSVSKSGYSFTGWYSGTSKVTPNTAATIVDSTVSLTSHWSVVTYSLTYNLNSGTLSGQKTDYTIESANFSIPNPTRSGYTFTGWSGTGITGTSKSVTVNKGSTGNRSYTANWSLNTYKLTYNLNGGDMVNYLSSYNVTTPDYTLKTPTKVGYTFAGWTGSNGTTKQTTVTIKKGSAGNKSYTAYWNPIALKVTYHKNTSTTDTSTATQSLSYAASGNALGKKADGSYYFPTSGDTSKRFGTWTNNDKYFMGWSTSANGPIAYSTYNTITDDIILSKAPTLDLYAVWGSGASVIDSCAVSIDSSGFYIYANVVGEASRVQFPVWTMYQPAGASSNQDDIVPNWNSNTAASGTLGSYTVEGNTYNYRYLVKVADHNNEHGRYLWSVYAFNPDGSMNPEHVDKDYYFTSKLTITSYSGATATGVNKRSSEESSRADIPLSSPNTYELRNNSINTLTANVSNGYSWLKWSDGNTSQTRTFTQTLTDTTLTPLTILNTYNLTYELHGGTIVDPKTTYYITTPTFKVPNATKPGYTFNGWYVNNIFEGTNYYVNLGSYGNKNLDADFSVNEYSINYEVGEGSLETDKVSFNIETNTFTLDQPTRIGYNFKGWTGNNGTTPQTTVTITKGSIGNRSYTAVWEARNDISYTVEHYTQDVEMDNYSLYSTEDKTGTADTKVTPAVLSLQGFTSPSAKEVVIAPDGSTVVKYMYNRNKYNLKISYDVGLDSVLLDDTAVSSSYTKSIPYNSYLELKNIVKYGYTSYSMTVDGVKTTDLSYAFNMPSKDVTVIITTAPIIMKDIKISNTKFTVGKGCTAYIDLTEDPLDALNKNYTLRYDTSILKVEKVNPLNTGTSTIKDLKVTSLAQGVSDITISSEDGGVTKTIKVFVPSYTVSVPASINVNDDYKVGVSVYNYDAAATNLDNNQQVCISMSDNISIKRLDSILDFKYDIDAYSKSGSSYTLLSSHKDFIKTQSSKDVTLKFKPNSKYTSFKPGDYKGQVTYSIAVK